MHIGIHAFVWLVLAAASAAAQTTVGVRAAALNVPSQGKTGFTLLPPSQTALTFTNQIDEWASVSNRVLNNGSGVAIGDFDNDGWMDVFFSSLNQRNRLFKNLGNWRFKDVTEETGLRFPALFYRGAVFADLNGDSWLDLLVGSVSQGVFCFVNDGRGHFNDATAQTGTASPFTTETLTLADIDGNGTLDLYACTYRGDDIRDVPRVPIMFVNRKPTVPPQLRDRITLDSGLMREFGDPDILYLNDGAAHFRSVSSTNGAFFDERGKALTNTPLDWGLAAAFRDLNGDGAPDLYVCNDYWTPDRIWINGGRGRFVAMDSLALRKTPASSMGVDFADINRDGHLDIFVVDMLSRSSDLRRRQAVSKILTAPRVGDIESRPQTPRNVLLLNRGDGTYAEIAGFAGLEASDWSWSPMFLDVDLDGYDDLLITAGHIRDIQDLDATDKIRAEQESWRRTPLAATNLPRAFLEARHAHSKYYSPLQMPIVAFRNGGDLRFTEATTGWGLDVPGVNHGMALADLDNDGDLDFIVNRLGAPAGVFRNETVAPRIAVRLRGKAPNTQAIGAKIELLGGAVSNQIQEVTSGGHYMSGSDTLCVFAPSDSRSSPRQEAHSSKSELDQSLLTSAATNVSLKLRILWRDGSVTEVASVKPNHLYEISEATAPRIPNPASRSSPPSPLFEDVSPLLSHSHHDEPFDDFARQSLLPRKLSQGGPGVAWFDVDGDGWDDLIVGSGKGGAMAIFRSQQGKSFIRKTNGAFASAVARDQTTILGWNRAAGQRAVLVGSASYEDGATNMPCAQIYDFTAGQRQSLLSGSSASIGPLTLADIDADGDLDLFAGGQIVPGKYPQPASSLVFRCVEGKFQRDEEHSRLLANIGLVNSAVWSDLDSDGFPELVLACEWGPIRIFHNERGKLTESNFQLAVPRHAARSTFQNFTGLWQSVTTGDFDGDGQLDIIAGNWGLNSSWRPSNERPLTILFGDLGDRNAVDILETEFDQQGQLAPRHLRDSMSSAVPWISARFPTHLAWSRSTVAEALKGREAKMQALKAVTLETTVFLNRKDHFEVRTLPVETQFAPTFGICVADFDGDGHEDIFLAQNFFASRSEESRLDAGRGLVLCGDGKGGFAPMSGAGSGIKVYGEQRGAAVSDFDHDGRADLAVTQNGAATKLFRNTQARAGLRVRLAGPAENPDGIGAMVRLKFPSGLGPVREVRAGGGYWSQDSASVVLGTPETPTAVQILWPGGHRNEQSIFPDTSEVAIQR